MNIVISEKVKQFFYTTLICFFISVATYASYYYISKLVETKEEIAETVLFLPIEETYNPFLDVEFSEEYLQKALIYFEIQHPEWVLAQAKLETGYYKSDVFLEHNNLFGLYNSSRGRYFSFVHWSESVIAYKKWIQRPERYDSSKYNDYGEYLIKMGYAEDPQYINKVKSLM